MVQSKGWDWEKVNKGLAAMLFISQKPV